MYLAMNVTHLPNVYTLPSILLVMVMLSYRHSLCTSVLVAFLLRRKCTIGGKGELPQVLCTSNSVAVIALKCRASIRNDYCY